MNREKHTRREFLEKLAAGVTTAGAGAAIAGDLIAKGWTAAPGEMPYRTLGRSGEKISLLGLGGGALAARADARSHAGPSSLARR